MIVRALLVVLFAAVGSSHGMPQPVTGGVRTYEVAAGDTLSSIGARFGLEAGTLARDNGIRTNAVLRPGNRLLVDNRHVAPAAGPAADGIVLNVPQRMLFVFRESRPLAAFPVAVGRSDWRTPLGAYAILVKETDPVWDVPVSIQAEMARQNKPVLTRVLPGPDNPLGGHWLGLDAAAVGIHGTNQPASIYRFTTHGCIRVHPDDMRQLFDLASVGMPVRVVYETLLLGQDETGAVFLEAHRDPYGKGGATQAKAAGLLRDAGLDRLIGSAVVTRVLAEKAGRAVAILDIE